MWDLYEPMKWKQNHELREQLTGDCQREGAWGRGDSKWKVEVNRCKLLYIE